MSSCKLVIKDEVNVKFENLSLEWRKRLSNKFKYEIPYARHLPAVKLGRWDGKVSFFGLGGTTYLNLVDQILPILEEGGVYVDFEDRRPKHNFEFKTVDKNYFSIFVYKFKLFAHLVKFKYVLEHILCNLIANHRNSVISCPVVF